MRNTIVVLVIAATLAACNKQEATTVPDVVQNPTFVTDAIDRMQASGFRTRIESRQNETTSPGFVLEYTPRTAQPKGALITLTVASRDRDRFALNRDDEAKLSRERAEALRRFYLQQIKYPVPEAEGMFVVDAIRLMQGHGFRVAVTTDVDKTRKPGTVLDQLPSANTELRWGSDVTLYVTVTRPYEPALSEQDAERLSEATTDTLRTMFTSMPQPVDGPPLLVHRNRALPIKPKKN